MVIEMVEKIDPKVHAAQVLAELEEMGYDADNFRDCVMKTAKNIDVSYVISLLDDRFRDRQFIYLKRAAGKPDDDVGAPYLKKFKAAVPVIIACGNQFIKMAYWNDIAQMLGMIGKITTEEMKKLFSRPTDLKWEKPPAGADVNLSPLAIKTPEPKKKKEPEKVKEPEKKEPEKKEPEKPKEKEPEKGVDFDSIEPGHEVKATSRSQPGVVHWGIVVKKGSFYPGPKAEQFKDAIWAVWAPKREDAEALAAKTPKADMRPGKALKMLRHPDFIFELMGRVKAPEADEPAEPPKAEGKEIQKAGKCTTGDSTTLLELTDDLKERNEKHGEHWDATEEVTIIKLTETAGFLTAVITNLHNEVWHVQANRLACFSPPEPKAVPAKEPEKEKKVAVPERVPDEIPPPPELKGIEVYITKYKVIVDAIKRLFSFTDRKDGQVFFSTWLMRDGSCLLKGAPGSGKTVLLTCTALAMSGIRWMTKPEIKNDHKRVLAWLGDNDYYGVAQYNADKEPEDVFFFTDISINKKLKPERLVGKDFDEIAEYDFKPRTRPVVNCFLKLHNESNRIGPNVADALLGMLAEKYVEYKGKIFTSPRVAPFGEAKNGQIEAPPGKDAWEEWQKKAALPKDDSGHLEAGHLNFFDYNPHLDLEKMEMDRAMLDRIDVGIYLSAGGAGTRYKIVKGRVRKTALKGGEAVEELIPDVPKAFFMDILKLRVIPLDPYEVMRMWPIVEQVYVDDEALRWIAFFTNLPNFTIRKYRRNSYFTTDEDGKAVPIEGFIDPTVISYDKAKDEMEAVAGTVMVGAGGFDEFAAIDALDRPLGSRSAISLLNLIKAWTFHRHIIDGTPLEFVVNDTRIGDANDRKTNRDDKISTILDLLPYVLDHRVNIGVESELESNFLNFAHFIRYYFKPYLFDNVDKNYRKAWMESMEVIQTLGDPQTEEEKKAYLANHPEEPLVSGARRDEFISKMAVRLNKNTPETLTAYMNDPFLIHIYILAGSTLRWGG